VGEAMGGETLPGCINDLLTAGIEMFLINLRQKNESSF
jgi:hypothetical protein